VPNLSNGEHRLVLVDRGVPSQDDLLPETAMISVELASMLRIMTIDSF
jgi:hypothetical protein